jgi:hypothetical protein
LTFELFECCGEEIGNCVSNGISCLRRSRLSTLEKKQSHKIFYNRRLCEARHIRRSFFNLYLLLCEMQVGGYVCVLPPQISVTGANRMIEQMATCSRQLGPSSRHYSHLRASQSLEPGKEDFTIKRKKVKEPSSYTLHSSKPTFPFNSSAIIFLFLPHTPLNTLRFNDLNNRSFDLLQLPAFPPLFRTSSSAFPLQHKTNRTCPSPLTART